MGSWSIWVVPNFLKWKWGHTRGGGGVFMGVNEPDLWVLSLADVGYLEDDKPASIVVGIESPLSTPSQQNSPLVLKLALSCYKPVWTWDYVGFWQAFVRYVGLMWSNLYIDTYIWVVRLVSKNGHQNNIMRYDDIRLCDQNMSTILGSIARIFERAYVIT